MNMNMNLYYGSYLSPRVLVWSIGVIILVLMMGVVLNIFSNSPFELFTLFTSFIRSIDLNLFNFFNYASEFSTVFTSFIGSKDLNLFNGSVLESLTAGIITQQRTFCSCSVVHMEKKEESNIPAIDKKQEFSDLDRLLELSKNHSSNSLSEDTENWKLQKSSIIEQVMIKNQSNSQNGINSENLISPFETWIQWRKENAYWNTKCNEIWDKIRKPEIAQNVLNENNLSVGKYIEFLNANKTVISELKNILVKNKPLGSAGDITVNELISKGLEIIETPLVQMITENVDPTVVGGFLSSMIMYKTIVNLYIKSAYGKNLPDSLKNVPSTKAKEIALFMLVGAPFVAGWLWTGKTIMGGKVVVNIATELVGTDSIRKIDTEGIRDANSISKSSFFFFLNKLPSWLKTILKYIALYYIGKSIVKVLGYNSNIINEIYSQFAVYLEWYLKFFWVLNFLILIYYLWKLYIIVMFANNKEYLNPEDYPKFIKNELIESKDIAIKIYLKNPGIIYKHYFKLIFIYSSIVLFGVLVIILYTNSL